jgi:hypothetical protein
VKLSGWRKFDLWLTSEPSSAEVEEAFRVLFAICDGTYVSEFHWLTDAIDDAVCHVLFADDRNTASWRVHPHREDTVQLIFVGPVEFF